MGIRSARRGWFVTEVKGQIYELRSQTEARKVKFLDVSSPYKRGWGAWTQT